MTRHRKEETLSEYSAKLARGIEFLEKYRQLCPEDQKLIMQLVDRKLRLGPLICAVSSNLI